MSGLVERSHSRKHNIDGHIFENIVDQHDEQVDLLSVITLPDGFMIEIGIVDLEGRQGLRVWAGKPMPGEDCPPELLYIDDIKELKEQRSG